MVFCHSEETKRTMPDFTEGKSHHVKHFNREWTANFLKKLRCRVNVDREAETRKIGIKLNDKSELPL